MTERFLGLVKDALRGVDQSYYRLVTAYEPGGIVRERVFCYELYHQMRLRMPDHEMLTTGDGVLALHAEIDKRGHQGFRKGDRRNPDFVFHIPGNFEGNTLVVEVKGIINPDGIEKDLDTLIKFIGYRYSAGLFILYNCSFIDLAERINEKTIALIRDNPDALIYIFSIIQAGSEIEEHRLSDLITSPWPK